MDTICAIATARATAAIGVIRVSGKDALAICDKIITPKTGKLSDSKSGMMRLCSVRDGDTELDSALCVIFKAPNSYTGENTVEINCHGGVSVLDRVMRLLIKNGARYALGGEFTKRAFLNGKMDLIQAEAVCDLINSNTALEGEIALKHISGKLSGEFDGIFENLAALNTDILAYIDFPDEGLSDVSDETVLARLNEIRTRLETLEKSFEIGSVIRDGADTVIAGAPNVGKSTLLNAVLGYERAIVSDTAGTTRDVVSERASLGNITLNLSDTAGIRDSREDIENKGIELAKERMKSADLILAVFDGSKELSADDMNIIELCHDRPAIAVINKSDLAQKINFEYISKAFIHTVHISARNNEGIDKLAKAVSDMFKLGNVSAESGMLVTNARHFERIVKAKEKVISAIRTVENGFTPDIASIDITDAASEIGRITGADVTDKIIDDIFSKFCVGK